MIELTPYSVLLSRIDARDGEASVEVPDDWLQGRTLFGGVQVAIALAAMRSVAPAAPLRTLQATFLAPVPGGLVRAKARVLRSGKSVTHVEGRLVNGDETLALVIGVFGQARASAATLRPTQPFFEAATAAAPVRLPGAPSFTQHFDSRWVVGSPPFTGGSNPLNVVEVSMRDPGPASEAHVVAMADYIPPVALSFLRERVPAASLTWMLEMLVEDVGALPLAGWRIDARMVASSAGYTNQSLMLWGPGGVPVAQGHQSMVVFG